VARRLTVHDGAPWGIDRIDTNGEHPKLSLLLAPSASVRAYCDRPTLAPCTGSPIDGKYDDGDLGGQGVRVYVVDSGIQDSNVDFGGRVVNGHTVRAAPVVLAKDHRARAMHSAILPAYQHPTHTTRPSITHTPPPNPFPCPSLLAVPRAQRMRLVPSGQRHPPRRRHWMRRARHPRGLDRRRPQLRRRKGSDAGAGVHVLRSPMLGRDE
jgi:hypothetical protein